MRARLLTICIGVLSACLFAGCAAPPPETPAPAPQPAASAPVRADAPKASPAPAAVAAPSAPAVAPAPPAPAESAKDALADRAPGLDPGNPDRGCKTDADCAVKDVGNCCGRFPMCVNKAAKTDPAAVRAQCANSGMASICGFEEITACQCVRGQCQSAGAGGAVAM